MATANEIDTEQVKYNLGRMKEAADEGRIKAFLAVTIQVDSRGRLVPEITTVAPGDFDQARLDTIVECLSGIARALQTVYDPPAVCTRAPDESEDNGK
jgi:hypothetical protein